MSISLTDIVNRTMATFIKGSMCEILALISAQQKEIINELEKFPLAKRILVENEVDDANDKIIELLTELETTFLVETAEENLKKK
jgi:hypothetical protein